MDGQAPTTWWQGLISGVAHPVLALDHLACLLVLGLWLAPQSSRLLGWASFLFATLFGCLLCMQFNLELHVDLVTAASVGVAGAVLASRVKLPTPALVPLLLAVGMTHGLAYGESMLGAPLAARLGYLLGLLLAQGFVLFTASQGARRFSLLNSPGWNRVMGVLALTISVGLLVLALEG